VLEDQLAGLTHPPVGQVLFVWDCWLLCDFISIFLSIPLPISGTVALGQLAGPIPMLEGGILPYYWPHPPCYLVLGQLAGPILHHHQLSNIVLLYVLTRWLATMYVSCYLIIVSRFLNPHNVRTEAPKRLGGISILEAI